MSRELALCTGFASHYACSLRDQCRRYRLHLYRKDDEPCTYLTHEMEISDLRLPMNIIDGCCEFIPDIQPIISVRSRK